MSAWVIVGLFLLLVVIIVWYTLISISNALKQVDDFVKDKDTEYGMHCAEE